MHEIDRKLAEKRDDISNGFFCWPKYDIVTLAKDVDLRYIDLEFFGQANGLRISAHKNLGCTHDNRPLAEVLKIYVEYIQITCGLQALCGTVSSRLADVAEPQ